MAKRSRRNQGMDIVSETQQNSRWLMGRRTHTFVSDKSKAEWSSTMRNLFAENKAGKNPAFIYTLLLGVVLLAVSYSRLQDQGVTLGSVFVIGLTVLVWAWILRAIARLFEKE